MLIRKTQLTLVGLTTLLASLAQGQVSRAAKPVRTPTIVASASVRPFDAFTVANGSWRLQTAYTDVTYYRTDPTGAGAVLMHGSVPVQPTKSTIGVVATGLPDAAYLLRVDFQKVFPAASVTVRQVGGAGATAPCSLTQMPSGTQSCSLTTRLQGGGTLTFELIVDSGNELVPSLVTLSQLSQ